MASTSALSVQKNFKYDVFLSFRGEDTRKTFVDHLYVALVSKGIITYKDDEKIEKGERIGEQLNRSIQDSRFHIIVFSKNYASSSWCLDELVKIIECQKMKEHTAYPVFYDVEPTEVRHQSGAFGEAFAKLVAKHENSSWMFSFFELFARKKMSEDVDQEKEEDVKRWRYALNEAAGLAGMELKNTFNGHEARIIQQIVQDISLKLCFINLSVDGKLVGMETRVKNVVSSLEYGSDDIRMIGIKGIGGGGKTTLARAIFDHISIWFEGKSFVENVREVSKGSGLKELQKQILLDVLNDKSIVENISDGKNRMKNLMRGKKVLVVLDDVDHINQLEALAGDITWFKPGSRIIITTRDEQVLVAHGVHSYNIHDVSLLSHEEANCLFSRYALMRVIPNQGYEELSRKVVNYAAGLPLTIKVLGSHLCGRSEREWEDALERLKTIPLKETLEILELSYNGLENDQKEIFLDVVCILKGEMKDEAIRILESCGFRAHIGLSVLEQKSLITVSSTDGLRFHDHIEEMGWNIVRRLHPHEPSRHNRLWIKEEIEDILVNELGTEATRSIRLNDAVLHTKIIMKGLRKMKELRFLFVNPRYKTWEHHGVHQYLPDTLQSLNWRGYPYIYLPKSFQANKLVNLEMVGGKISELWEGSERKVLNKLRFLDLTCSKLSTLDLSMTPHLEKLNLLGCYKFSELQMSVACPKLKFVNLYGSMVRNFNLGLTPNLETLGLLGCKEFVKLHVPVKCPNLKFLHLAYSKMSNLNLGMIPHLEELQFSGAGGFVELLMPVECPNLKSLNLNGSMVSNLNLGMTPHLEMLDLSNWTEFVELELPVECKNLKSLNLSGSKVSKLNLGMTPHLEELHLVGCNEFVEFNLPFECRNLKSLNLSGSKVSNLNLGMTPHLETLDLSKCNEFVELYLPVECPNLKSLNLSGSKVGNLNLRMTPHLQTLDLSKCNEFVELHLPVECLSLKFLYLCGSKVSKLNLGMTPHLEELRLEGCNEFVELHLPVECSNFKFLDLRDTKVGNLNLGMTPHLETLNLQGCYCLQKIHAPVGCLKKLVYLNLTGSLRFKHFLIDKRYLYPHFSMAKLELTVESVDICPLHPNNNLPKFQFQCKYAEPVSSWSGNVEKLISFGLCACTNLESFSSSISGLQDLRELTLNGSISEVVPKDLWQIESLEKLILCLKEIKHLPNSICMMKHLKSLELKSCWLLEQLTMDFDRLQCLEELRLTDCIQLRDIPNSVRNMKCLRHLHISYCSQVKELPKENLEPLLSSICGLQHFRELTLEGGIPEVPKDLYRLESLEKLSLRMEELKHLPDSICMMKYLKSLDLSYCRSLQDIPDNICNLKCLENLDLRQCIRVENLPEEFGRLESLKKIYINGTGIRSLPQSIYQLKGLRINGSREELKSCGFESLKEVIPGFNLRWYVEL